MLHSKTSDKAYESWKESRAGAVEGVGEEGAEVVVVEMKLEVQVNTGAEEEVDTVDEAKEVIIAATEVHRLPRLSTG